MHGAEGCGCGIFRAVALHKSDDSAQINDIVVGQRRRYGVRAFEVAVHDVAAHVVSNDTTENVVILFVNRFDFDIRINCKILDRCRCNISEESGNAIVAVEIEIRYNVSSSVKFALEISLLPADRFNRFAVEIDIRGESHKRLCVFILTCVDAVGKRFKLCCV